MPITTANRSSNGAALRALADRRAYALAPLIAEIRENGVITPTEIAHRLNQCGSVTHCGNAWTSSQVRRVLVRLEEERQMVPSTSHVGVKGNTANRARALARMKELLPIVREIQSSGIITQKAIASTLNARKISAPRGGRWTAPLVGRLLARLKKEFNAFCY